MMNLMNQEKGGPMSIDVTITTTYPVVLVECSLCGPVGVATGPGVAAAEEHLRSHFVTSIEKVG